MAETRKGLVARTASLNNKRGLLCGGEKKEERKREREKILVKEKHRHLH